MRRIPHIRHDTQNISWRTFRADGVITQPDLHQIRKPAMTTIRIAPSTRYIGWGILTPSEEQPAGTGSNAFAPTTPARATPRKPAHAPAPGLRHGTVAQGSPLVSQFKLRAVRWRTRPPSASVNLRRHPTRNANRSGL